MAGASAEVQISSAAEVPGLSHALEGRIYFQMESTQFFFFVS